MAERLVVIHSPEIRDEYLAAWMGLTGLGYDPRTVPASRILRLLRYPVQRAIIWPDVPSENSPLPYGAVVRLPVLREATKADRQALERFRDYAASVRAAAMAALGEDLPPGERRLIALQLAGRRRARAVLILTESEIEEVGHHAGNTGGQDPDGGAPAP